MTPEVLSIYSTYPDVDAARRILRTLVSERLGACANPFPAREARLRRLPADLAWVAAETTGGAEGSS